MKADEGMLTILDFCAKIDGKAAAIYHYFSINEKDPGLKDFWKKMSEDEKGHVRSWQILSGLAVKGSLQQIFENPRELEKDLETVLPMLGSYLKKSKGPLSIAERFSIACHIELFMLRRYFIHLFYLMKSLSHEGQPIDDYEAHLKKFIDKLKEYGNLSDLTPVVTAINRLWRDNLDLVTTTNEDYLTKVFNRRGFFQTAIPLAYMAQREKKNIAVMMIDVDKFKLINDNYGHQTGDEVLSFIASTVIKYIRRSDIVCRYGGEEFVVFLSDADTKYLYHVAEKVRRGIEEDNRRPFPVTVSIGVAYKKLKDNIENEFQKLIKEADDNMYTAKEAGRNRVCCKALKTPCGKTA